MFVVAARLYNDHSLPHHETIFFALSFSNFSFQNVSNFPLESFVSTMSGTINTVKYIFFSTDNLQLQSLSISWTTVTEPALAASTAADGYLADLISPYSPSRSLRSSTQKLLSVPPHNLDTAARPFSVAAPRL